MKRYIIRQYAETYFTRYTPHRAEIIAADTYQKARARQTKIYPYGATYEAIDTAPFGPISWPHYIQYVKDPEIKERLESLK